MTKVSHDSEVAANGQQVFTACAFIHKKIDGVDHVFLPSALIVKSFYRVFMNYLVVI